MTMGRPRNDSGEAIFTREAWKVVAQGGWWKSGEIVEALPDHVSTLSACNLLGKMADRGNLERRGEARSYEYAVTQDSVVPSGLLVSEVVEAATGKAVG